MQPTVRNYNFGIIGLGIVLVVIGLVIPVLLPAFVTAGAFLAKVGYVCIVVGILIFIVNFVRGLFGA